MYKIKRKSSYNIIELNNNTFLIYNIFKNILKNYYKNGKFIYEGSTRTSRSHS